MSIRLTIPQLLRRGLGLALWPPRCCLCGGAGRLISGPASPWQRWLRQPLDLCAECERVIPLSPVPWVHNWGGAQFAPFAYRWPADRLIQRYKFDGERVYGRVLAELFAERRRASREPLPQVIVPLPLHRRRLAERGFEQTLLLAEWIGAALALPLAPQALRRVRATRAQSGLTRAERQSNVAGAFAAPPELGRSWRHVALLDDVVTTGSTLNAAAAALRLAGVRHIETWALARAAPRLTTGESAVGSGVEPAIRQQSEQHQETR
jgi:ComF family protein